MVRLGEDCDGHTVPQISLATKVLGQEDLIITRERRPPTGTNDDSVLIVVKKDLLVSYANDDLVVDILADRRFDEE